MNDLLFVFFLLCGLLWFVGYVLVFFLLLTYGIQIIQFILLFFFFPALQAVAIRRTDGLKYF